MNEQIKELAHKAEFINKRHNGDEWRWGYIDPELSVKLEKFAELIVQECCFVGEQYADGLIDSKHYDFVNKKVKEHFGVGE